MGNIKTGLVLEGGAMRGMFTAGVLDVFIENGIDFDGLIGVSAGACFGCSYQSGQHGRTFRYNVKYCRDKRYCSFRNLILTGDMYGKKFCYYDLPEKLDVFDKEAFNNSRMKFYIVATDVETGKPVYRSFDKAEGDFTEFMRASASMPFVSRIVKVGGKKLLDGGISDSIPLEYFEKEGYNRNIVVTTRELGYTKEKNPLSPIAPLVYARYPNMAKAIAERHIMYNRQLEYIAEREKNGSVLVIRPEKPLELKHAEHDEEKLRVAYESGRAVAEKRLCEIKKFLGI